MNTDINIVVRNNRVFINEDDVITNKPCKIVEYEIDEDNIINELCECLHDYLEGLG